MGISMPKPPMTSSEPLPPSVRKPLILNVPGIPQPFEYQDPANTAGQGTFRSRSQTAPTPTQQPAASTHPAAPPLCFFVPVTPSQLQDRQQMQPASQAHPRNVEGRPVPRSTAHYHRRAAREEEETGIPRKKYAARTKVSTCSKCKLPREMASHTQYYGSWYCANTAKETKEEWRARMVAKREEKMWPKGVKMLARWRRGANSGVTVKVLLLKKNSTN